MPVPAQADLSDRDMGGKPWRTVAKAAAGLLAVAYFFRAAQNMALTSLSLLGKQADHLGPGGIGIVAALTGLAGIAGTLAASRVSTANAPKALVAGVVVMFVAFPVLALPGGMGMYVAGALALGLGGGFAFPNLSTAIARSDPRQPGRMLAAYAVVLSLSLATGPLLEAVILSGVHGSLRATFGLYGVVALVAALVAAWLARTHALGLSGGGSRSDRVHRSGGRDGGLVELLGNRHWQIATLAQLIYQVPFIAIVVFGAVIARDVDHLSTIGAEIAYTVFFTSSFTVRSAVLWRSPIANKSALFTASTILTAVGMAILGLGGGAAGLGLAMAVLGVPHGLIYPLGLALIAEEVPNHQLARANAAFAAVTGVVATVTPGILGVLAGAVGLKAMCLFILVPVVALGAVLVALGRGGRHQARSAHGPS